MSPSADSREAREFAREIKFRLSPELAAAIEDWIGPRLQPDPNASTPDGSGYSLSSLYFDTPEFDVFHRRGSYGRSKYRIRRYGRGDMVFLERKMRTKGRLTKRRSIVPLEDLARVGLEGDSGAWAGRWFQRRLEARKLGPVVRIAYERTARVAQTVNGPIRLTIDRDLRAVAIDSLSFVETGTALPVLPGVSVLELKFLSDMPTLFKALVEEFALVPEPTSKYRLAVKALRLVSPASPVESVSTGQSSIAPLPCLIS